MAPLQQVKTHECRWFSLCILLRYHLFLYYLSNIQISGCHTLEFDSKWYGLIIFKHLKAQHTINCNKKNKITAGRNKSRQNTKKKIITREQIETSVIMSWSAFIFKTINVFACGFSTIWSISAEFNWWNIQTTH